MRTFILAHDAARNAAVECVMAAPVGYVVQIREPRKSRHQEEKYHAMIGDVAAQFEFHGKRLDEETMKRLLIEQFRHETAMDLSDLWREVGSFDLSPSLDGSRVVMLGPQSRRFPKRLAMAFIEWLFAFGSEHGVRWTGAKVYDY